MNATVPGQALFVPSDSSSRFVDGASCRGITVKEVMLLVLHRVGEDCLLDAVLDDGEGSSTAVPEVARLRRELHLAQARIIELETAIGVRSHDFPVAWRLTRRQAQVLSIIAARRRVTKDQIAVAIYGDEYGGDAINVIESYISKLRAKLRPLGIEIGSRRNDGYWLADPERFRAAAVLP